MLYLKGNEKVSRMMLILLLGMVVSISGCSLKGDIQREASKELIVYNDSLTPNPQAERLLESALSNSKVPWDNDNFASILGARDAIKQMGQFIKFRLALDGTIPYYTYKETFAFIQFQYNILEEALDARVAVKGAITEEAEVIYYYVKRDIKARLYLQQQKITHSEKNINDRASANSIEELKGIYAAVKPLIDMAL